jgi:hypothetical protein
MSETNTENQRDRENSESRRRSPIFRPTTTATSGNSFDTFEIRICLWILRRPPSFSLSAPPESARRMEIEMPRKPFVPGNDGMGGGRPVGSRNKLQGDFLKALAEDFAQNGIGAIRIARVERPVEYLKVIASVLPKELVLEQSILADLSDEELSSHIALLQRLQASKVAEQDETIEKTKH